MSFDLEVRMVGEPGRIDAREWNTLLEGGAAPTPFMRHEYLLALHESGSATARTGWQPQFLAARRGGVLVAACPLYLKSHSYGEYVFDWAWADAYERHGLAYYPKLLCAVPFTPVPGDRLLAREPAERAALADAMRRLAADNGLSSVHLLFASEDDRAATEGPGWLARRTVQFHWLNPVDAPYEDFAAFLAALQRDKRKKIQQERRRVTEAGVTFDVLEGDAIAAADWDFFHRCYTLTYRAHHSTPYLTRDFFARMQAIMARHWVMFVARRGSERIAASLVAIDPARGAAFGRYWGCTEHVSCLHFEACYYQPLAWCIAHGYRRFEGGAQGEHKMARGLLPVSTGSSHWLAHPAFAQAVGDYLVREGAGVAEYLDELNERRPFKG